MVVVVFWNVALPPFKVVLFRTAMVAEAATRSVKVPVVAVRDVAVRFVAKRFVVVTVPKFPFHRRAAEPKASVTSRDGKRSVETWPETARFVVVTFVVVTFEAVTLPSVDWPVTFMVPVAVRFRV